MTLTASQQKVQDKYQSLFGRDASFGTLGGADYWVDKFDNQGLTDAEFDKILKGSAEYGTVTTADDGTKSSYLGGVDPNVGTGHSSNAGTWADHFKDGGIFGAGADLTGTIWEGMGGGAAGNAGTDDSASALNAIAAATGTPINNLGGAYYNMGSTGGGTTTGGTTTGGTTTGGTTTGGTTTGGTGTGGTGTGTGSTSWWDQFADIDAFKDALGLGTQQQSDGMGDFMKFMMLMSVMGGGRGMGGGGGYGGSQYGYGGLNPGGVMQSYDPLAQLQGMGTWFKDNFGSSGATTNTVNTGTTAGATLTNPANQT